MIAIITVLTECSQTVFVYFRLAVFFSEKQSLRPGGTDYDPKMD